MDVLKDGKKVPDQFTDDTLWSVEIVARFGNEIVLVNMINCTNKELTSLRVNVYQAGVMYWIDPGHYRLISPADILKIEVWRQNKYFEPKI